MSFVGRLTSFSVLLALSGCGLGSCEKYASDYSCNYVENDASYEIWYWRNVENDDENDNVLIGMSKGLHECKANAMGFANSIGEEWNDRAYICALIDDGERKEKHRLL